MKTTALFFLLLASAVHAGPRTSAIYSSATDIADAGGRRTTSTNYTNDGSAGGIAGIATVALSAVTLKCGYIGQLFDVTGITLTAATLNVNEGATAALAAWQALDDATFFTVPTASVAWSVASGPLIGISGAGLATAGLVYQSTPATVRGVFDGFTGSLNLTVLDSIPDNFGTYGGDGVGDDWQVQYFGQNNPLAGPAIDASGTGQTNLFKYVAGLNPLDPNSRFTLRVEPVPGQPGQKKLIFGPRFSDRTYTVKAKPSLLTGTYSALLSFSISDDGLDRTVTDLSASALAKFYTVEITRP